MKPLGRKAKLPPLPQPEGSDPLLSASEIGGNRGLKVDLSGASVKELIEILDQQPGEIKGIKRAPPPFSIVPARAGRISGLVNPTALKTLIIICSTCDRRGVSAIRQTTIAKMLGKPETRGRTWGNVQFAIDALVRHKLIRKIGQFPNNRYQVIYDPDADLDAILGKTATAQASDVIADDETTTALVKGVKVKAPKLEPETGGSGSSLTVDPAVGAAQEANADASLRLVERRCIDMARTLWGVTPSWSAADRAWLAQLIAEVGHAGAMNAIEVGLMLYRRRSVHPPKPLSLVRANA